MEQAFGLLIVAIIANVALISYIFIWIKTIRHSILREFSVSFISPLLSLQCWLKAIRSSILSRGPVDRWQKKAYTRDEGIRSQFLKGAPNSFFKLRKERVRPNPKRLKNRLQALSIVGT